MIHILFFMSQLYHIPAPMANAFSMRLLFTNYDLRFTILPPLKTTKVKNERKKVEEKGVKKREK